MAWGTLSDGLGKDFELRQPGPENSNRGIYLGREDNKHYFAQSVTTYRHDHARMSGLVIKNSDIRDIEADGEFFFCRYAKADGGNHEIPLANAREFVQRFIDAIYPKGEVAK